MCQQQTNPGHWKRLRLRLFLLVTLVLSPALTRLLIISVLLVNGFMIQAVFFIAGWHLGSRHPVTLILLWVLGFLTFPVVSLIRKIITGTVLRIGHFRKTSIKEAGDTT